MSTISSTDPYTTIRAVPLETIIGAIGGVRDVHHHSLESAYYHTAFGKLQVTTTASGLPQLWRFWSGSLAGTGGRGAIDFVLHTGLVTDLHGARDYLTSFVGTVVPAASTSPSEATLDQPFRPVPRAFDAAANWQAVKAYLVGERKLPESLIRAIAGQPHPIVYAGWGTKFGHYLIFPMRHPSDSQTHTGAILRWCDVGDPPERWFGGAKAAKAVGSRDVKGWWQVGPYGAETLIVTESPIDALSLWAGLSSEDRETTRIVATGGASRLTAPGIFANATKIFSAQDRDAAGEAQAEQMATDVVAAGLSISVQRLRPPQGAKDWNDAWRAGPSVVRRCLARQMYPDLDYGLSR